MFDEFLAFFSIVGHMPSSVTEFLTMFGGKSFGKGIYRLHTPSEITRWNSIISDAFPSYEKENLYCFGYDWLGRQFALKCPTVKNESSPVYMFEPGTGEVLEIPCSFLEFHNQEIVQYHDACLASSFFNCWHLKNKVVLKNDECVGYRVPLFLGGKDEVENLEVSNMEVYWSICSQLF